MERQEANTVCPRHRSDAPHSTTNALVTTDSSSNYFSLASKHFNTTSPNELVLFSRFRANLSFLPSFLSPPFNSSSFLDVFRRAQEASPSPSSSDQPPLNTGPRRARIISIVRAAIIHPAKKIIKCL